MHNIGKACGRSVPIVRRRSISNNNLRTRLGPSANARSERGDVARTRRSDNERSSCQVLFVSYQQVRCHKNVNMSTKICVCVDRVSVQMVLPV